MLKFPRAKSSPMCDFRGPEGVSRVESTNHTRHKLKIHNCLMNGIVCRTVVDKSHQTPDSWANSRGLLGNHPRSTHAFSSCSPAGSLHSKHTAPPPHPRTWRYREARRRQDLVFSVYVNYGLATLCFAKCLNWESWSVLELLCRVWESWVPHLQQTQQNCRTTGRKEKKARQADKKKKKVLVIFTSICLTCLLVFSWFWQKLNDVGNRHWGSKNIY